MQMDALREVANIGCGHAANVLSRLIGGKRVDVSLPQAFIAPAMEVAGRLGEGEAPLVVAKLGMQGELGGLLLVVLPEAAGRALEDLLLQRSDAPPEERESALAEAANILASACLSAIGGLTGWRLLPTVPTVVRGQGQVVVSGAVAEAETEGRVLVLEARFAAASEPAVHGRVVLALESQGSRALLARLGV
jgi:chemotaxis protein CheC